MSDLSKGWKDRLADEILGKIRHEDERYIGDEQHSGASYSDMGGCHMGEGYSSGSNTGMPAPYMNGGYPSKSRGEMSASQYGGDYLLRPDAGRMGPRASESYSTRPYPGMNEEYSSAYDDPKMSS